MERYASISECNRYRWWLRRVWDARLLSDGRIANEVNFVMLNPSTADAEVDDPTIRRCIGFAKAWGFAALTVTNLYALRGTVRNVWAAFVEHFQAMRKAHQVRPTPAR